MHHELSSALSGSSITGRIKTWVSLPLLVKEEEINLNEKQSDKLGRWDHLRPRGTVELPRGSTYRPEQQPVTSDPDYQMRRLGRESGFDSPGGGQDRTIIPAFHCCVAAGPFVL